MNLFLISEYDLLVFVFFSSLISGKVLFSDILFDVAVQF